MEIISIIGFVTTVISIAFGIFQCRKNANIKQIRISEALLLHKLSGQALGAIQGNNSNNVLKNISGEDKIMKVVYDIGLSEGYCQSLFIETAKIFCSLKNISVNDVNDMIYNEQLDGNYKKIYVSFSSNVKKRVLQK